MQITEYKPGTHPDLPPPREMVGVIGWLRKNLFSNPTNTAMTLLSLYLLYLILPPIIDWAFLSANWHAGTSRDDCTKEGACWTMIRARFGQLIYGTYPADLRWRVDISLLLMISGIIWVFWDRLRAKKFAVLFLFVIYPPIGFWLFYGGFGLEIVPTSNWGGLLLNIVTGIVGITASLPLGVLLALGRRSRMPIIRSACILFIEIVRGVPLISILFMASIMLPFFLPEGTTIDKLARAVVGIGLFSAAYMAEVIRGGLQAISRGQYEASQALGLSYSRMMTFIVMPQALRIVIPGIVNTFIGLFKDTTLVITIGLIDLLGSTQNAAKDTNWLGLAMEGYIFAALLFFIICYSISRYSQHLEKKLHTGHKR